MSGLLLRDAAASSEIPAAAPAFCHNDFGLALPVLTAVRGTNLTDLDRWNDGADEAPEGEDFGRS